MSESEFPKKVKAEELKDMKGLVAVLWRKGAKQAARIHGTEMEGTEVRVIYELLTEPDKGEIWSGKYDPTQEIVVYDEVHINLALLDK